MPLAFDGATKTVTITTDTELDVRDLWSRWVDWWLTSDNSKYGLAMSQVGGDDIDTVAGTKIPVYIYLLNGWKVKPKESNHTLNVMNGILLTDNSSDPFTNTTGSYIIRINYQQPVQAISFSTGGGGGSSITQQDVRDAMAMMLTSGETVEDGSIEKMLKELHQLQGLESGSIVEITDTSRVVNDGVSDVINQTIDDDGTTTTVERV